MKKVIRYLRFSNLGQSNGSIEAQELCTDQWISFNNAELIDTFIDVGKSAKTLTDQILLDYRNLFLNITKQLIIY